MKRWRRRRHGAPPRSITLQAILCPCFRTQEVLRTDRSTTSTRRGRASERTRSWAKVHPLPSNVLVQRNTLQSLPIPISTTSSATSRSSIRSPNMNSSQRLKPPRPRPLYPTCPPIFAHRLRLHRMRQLPHHRRLRRTRASRNNPWPLPLPFLQGKRHSREVQRRRSSRIKPIYATNARSLSAGEATSVDICVYIRASGRLSALK